MEIKWLDKNNKFGIVTFHKTTITMNVTIMRYFESAYKVRVGINDSKEIVLSALTHTPKISPVVAFIPDGTSME